MSATASVLRIPDFVKARSPQGLRDLMLEANARDGFQYRWQDIQWNPTDKHWYAWYMRLAEIDQVRGELLDGN